jgi:uncharacterized Zn finger protein (UPF0148 family)
MTDEIHCDKCGEQPTFEKEGQYDLLHVSCACEGRYVKVKEVLPERWSA